VSAMKTRMRVAEIEAMAPHRPAGYVDDVLNHGEVQGEWFIIENEALARLRTKYGKAVEPRPMPVSEPERQRCQSICDNCPGNYYQREIDYCSDPACGCTVATDRRDPARNRKTLCKWWSNEPEK
jgi:hypothetical protein